MTYLGYEVLDWIVPIDSISLSIKAKVNVIGEIYQNREINVQQNPYSFFNFTYKQDSNVERKELRDFFIARMGKHEEFFIRSHKNDLKLLYDVDVDYNTLIVSQGYDKIAFDINAKFLYIVGHDVPYNILSMVEGYDEILDEEVVSVQLDRNIDYYSEKGCTLIEFLYFGRWDTDTLTFDFNDIITSTASMPFREASDVEIGALL